MAPSHSGLLWPGVEAMENLGLDNRLSIPCHLDSGSWGKRWCGLAGAVCTLDVAGLVGWVCWLQSLLSLRYIQKKCRHFREQEVVRPSD